VEEVLKHRVRIVEICAKWRIQEFAVFGSAARGELRAESDIDVLVSFDPVVEMDLFDLFHLQDELQAVFGRKVDLVERSAIENSENWIVRREILGSAKPLYATT